MAHTTAHPGLPLPLKAPSTLQIVLGAALFAFESKRKSRHSDLPQRIGDLVLQKSIEKADDIQNLAIGIYESSGKRYLVKHWGGRVRDLAYYSLYNEYVATAILSAKNGSAAAAQGIYFPRVHAVHPTANAFSVVFEHVEGRLLKDEPAEVQAKALMDIHARLEAISKSLSAEESRALGRRGLLFYLFMMPALAALVCLKSPRDWKTVFSAIVSAVPAAFRLKRKPLVLAHRDLVPNNVMLTERGACVLDSENLLLTLPGYDRAFLSASLETAELGKKVSQLIPDENAGFLTKYIAMHHILGSGDFLNVNERHLGALASLNERAA